MTDFTNRFERLELKFLIDEGQVDRVRRRIESTCLPDPHGRGRGAYTISSLYLDSPSLAFHRAKERGDPDRLKLRVRTYSEDSRATLEMKRRRSNVIDKTRAVVDRERVEGTATGLLPAPDRRHADFFESFSRVVATVGALPTLHVRYEREAYESLVDDYARVTFDRQIRVARADDWSLRPNPDAWSRFSDHWGQDRATPPVVMEIKCHSSIPGWVTDLIRSEHLVQTSFSKYSAGIHVTNWSVGGLRQPSRTVRALA